MRTLPTRVHLKLHYNFIEYCFKFQFIFFYGLHRKLAKLTYFSSGKRQALFTYIWAKRQKTTPIDSHNPRLESEKLRTHAAKPRTATKITLSKTKKGEAILFGRYLTIEARYLKTWYNARCKPLVSEWPALFIPFGYVVSVLLSSFSSFSRILLKQHFQSTHLACF